MLLGLRKQSSPNKTSKRVWYNLKENKVKQRAFVLQRLRHTAVGVELGTHTLIRRIDLMHPIQCRSEGVHSVRLGQACLEMSKHFWIMLQSKSVIVIVTSFCSKACSAKALIFFSGFNEGILSTVWIPRSRSVHHRKKSKDFKIGEGASKGICSGRRMLNFACTRTHLYGFDQDLAPTNVLRSYICIFRAAGGSHPCNGDAPGVDLHQSNREKYGSTRYRQVRYIQRELYVNEYEIQDLLKTFVERFIVTDL